MTATPPLEGVRVLDVTRFLAGPYASMILAELGADVIKLEDPDRPDEARSVGPYFQHGHSLYFAALNAGKRSVAVRTSTEEGRSVVRALALTCDVVLDNNKPGVMTKIGLGTAQLRAANPRLVTCSLSGYGATGPEAGRPGYDYTIQAQAGVMSMTGEPGGPPGKAGVSYVDHSGGITAALAVCAALVGRSSSGLGRHVDLSLFDLQVSMLSYLAAWHLNAGYEGGRTADAGHPSLVPAQNFRTADGHVSVFVGNDTMWRRLVAILADDCLSSPDLDTNARRLAEKPLVVGRLGEVLGVLSTADALATLERAGVPSSPVNSLAEALAEPQLVARSMVVDADHPVYGPHRRVAGPMGDLRATAVRSAPVLGEHTVNVLLESGVSRAAVDEMVAAGKAFQNREGVSP